MVLLVFKGIALVADLAAKFCCTLHTSAHHYSLMYDSEMKHTLVMDREVYIMGIITVQTDEVL